MALLRIFDHEHFELLERDLPSNRPQKMECVTRESLDRPEVQRWRRSLKERYARPPSPHVLLLLPCSARKPYSMSKTHRRFAEALMPVSGRNCVHEVIVTSPLGVVPRELELFYPANCYDIPVIGVWDDNERAMIRRTLSDFLAKNRYDACVCHFPDREMVAPVLEAQGFKLLEYSCLEHRPTSQGSLKRLRECVESALAGTKAFPSGQKRHAEDMRARLGFLFSQRFAEALPPFEVVGRYPHVKIMAGSKQLGMYVEERGSVSLTLEGARLLRDLGQSTVTIDEFPPKGTIFAQGVKAATDDIRPGDDVVVVNKGYIAVGVAHMSGREMRSMGSGPAVSVRHYEKVS
jgi:archaeosine synthase